MAGETGGLVHCFLGLIPTGTNFSLTFFLSNGIVGNLEIYIYIYISKQNSIENVKQTTNMQSDQAQKITRCKISGTNLPVIF